MSGPLSRAGPGAPAVGDWRVQWKSWEGLQWGRDFLSSPFQPPSPPPPSPGPRARRRASGGGAEGPAAVRAGPAGPGVLAGVPHAPSPCVAEEDGQPRVPRRPGLRGRRPVDVLQLLQVQPAGPRGGGHGPEAAGTPRRPGARGSWRDRGVPGRAALGGGRGVPGRPAGEAAGASSTQRAAPGSGRVPAGPQPASRGPGDRRAPLASRSCGLGWGVGTGKGSRSERTRRRRPLSCSLMVEGSGECLCRGCGGGCSPRPSPSVRRVRFPARPCGSGRGTPPSPRGGSCGLAFWRWQLCCLMLFGQKTVFGGKSESCGSCCTPGSSPSHGTRGRVLSQFRPLLSAKVSPSGARL